MSPELEKIREDFQTETKKEKPDKEKVYTILKEMWDEGEDGQRMILRSIVSLRQGYNQQQKPIIEGYIIPFCELNKIRLTKKLLYKYRY